MVREAGLYEADRGGELATDADDEAVPQLARVCVPEGVCRVAVAVGAQRLADEGSVRVMDRAATEGPIVFARPANPTRAASFPGTVDRAEGRGSQGDEESGSLANDAGDVLAAEEARADEVEGVACVEAGARRADGRASVAAADEEAFAGLVAGVVVAEDLAGFRVQGGGRT